MKIRDKVILSVLSGMLLAFSFPNFVFKTMHVPTSFFIWIAFSPLFYIFIRENSVKNSFFCGLLAGSVFYITGIYWLVFVKPMGAFAAPAMLVLSVYFSSLIGLSGLLSKLLEKRTGAPLIITLPAIMTVIEWAREWMFTGWPILTPAQSQHSNTVLIQMLKIAGVPAMNCLIYSANILIAAMAAEKYAFISKPGIKAAAALAAVLLVIAGIGNMYGFKEPLRVPVAILQPDIDQNVPWDAAYTAATMQTFRELTDEAKKEPVKMFVWPETAFPGTLNGPKGPAAAAEIASWTGGGSYSLVGSDMFVRGPENSLFFYNGAFLLDPRGNTKNIYAKHHLVPFGEYVPFQETIPLVKKVVQRYGYVGFSPGKSVEPMQFDNTKFGANICFDGFFPEISRALAAKGARFFTHMSYETWYADSPASAQIFGNVILRAVENNVYLVRAVASGISGVCDNKGRIVAELGLFRKGVLNAVITTEGAGKAGTFYTSAGDWFILFCLAWISGAAAYWAKRRAS